MISLVSRRAFATSAKLARTPINIFSHLLPDPPDTIFGIVDQFMKDKHPLKVNLSIGIYRTAEGKSHVFRAVRKADEDLTQFGRDNDYLSPEGDAFYLKCARELIFGADHPHLHRVS